MILSKVQACLHGLDNITARVEWVGGMLGAVQFGKGFDLVEIIWCL